MLKDQQLLKRNKDFFFVQAKKCKSQVSLLKMFWQLRKLAIVTFFSVCPQQSEVDYEVLENIQMYYFPNLYQNTYYHEFVLENRLSQLV